MQEKMQISLESMAKLLEQTNDVEYDMEAYAKDSLKVINEIVGSANKCKGKTSHPYSKFNSLFV